MNLENAKVGDYVRIAYESQIRELEVTLVEKVYLAVSAHEGFWWFNRFDGESFEDPECKIIKLIPSLPINTTKDDEWFHTVTTPPKIKDHELVLATYLSNDGIRSMWVRNTEYVINSPQYYQYWMPLPKLPEVGNKNE